MAEQGGGGTLTIFFFFLFLHQKKLSQFPRQGVGLSSYMIDLSDKLVRKYEAKGRRLNPPPPLTPPVYAPGLSFS